MLSAAASRRPLTNRRLLTLLLVVGLLAGAAGAVPSGASPGPGAGGPAPEDPNRVLVVVDDPGDAPDVADDAGARGADGQAVAPAEVTELSLPDQQIDQLEADPRVAAVLQRGEATVQPALQQSVAKVDAPARWAAGHRGAGKVVVVIDTGVSPAFGGTLVGQACFAATLSGATLTGHCGPSGGATQAFSGTCFDLGVCDQGSPDDVRDDAAGRPCGASRSCSHGSAVAAVAARHEPVPGVAPDAGVYAIRVFDPQGSVADLYDLYLALGHVVDLVDAGLEVASVNLSVASSVVYPGPCDGGDVQGGAGAAYASVLRALLARDVPTVVASGNSGVVGSLAFPACLSPAVSVASTDLDDRVSSFSNTGRGLDLFAPGAGRSSGPSTADLQIPNGTASTSWAGTSFSAPHVAGAFALTEQEYPRSSIAQRTWILAAGGVPVRTADGRTYPRLRLREPVDVLHGGAFMPLGRIPGGGAQGAVADFDGDGFEDLFSYTPGGTADRVTWGGPSWTRTATSASISYTYRALAGQFHGSSSGPDDVLLYGAGGAVDKIWAGRADRTFTSLAASFPTAGSPVVGDFDGDGWDDVLISSPGASDQLRYGGAGGFSPPVALPVSDDARAVALDIDGDGQDELVQHRPGSTPDRLWRFTSRSTFTSEVIALGTSASISATPLVADLDGNGGEDLLLIRSDGTGVRLRPVGGAFRPPTSTPSGALGNPAVGDLDGNGADDVVWVRTGTTPDWAWYGLYSGAISRRQMSITGSYRPRLADLDGDGGDDLVLLTAGTTVQLWWNAR
jgi:hypothetical protein